MAHTRVVPKINTTHKIERLLYVLLVSARYMYMYLQIDRKLFLGEPDAPTAVQVSEGASEANELKFTWTAPIHYCDNDFPVTSYRLMCRGGGSTSVNVIVSAPSTERVVPESSFQSAVHYGCSVIVENAIGNSSQSNPFLLMGDYR